MKNVPEKVFGKENRFWYRPETGFSFASEKTIFGGIFMKNMRKVLAIVLLVAIVACLSVALTACGKKYVQQTDTAIYFTVDEKLMKDAGCEKLIDYLNALVEKKQLTYSAPDMGGYKMIVTINDRTADAAKGEYWFIYSDDEEFSNEEWGTCELNGKTYKSTTDGIEQLTIKAGKTYVFMISVSQW